MEWAREKGGTRVGAQDEHGCVDCGTWPWGGWGLGTSPLPDEVSQLLGGDGPLLHAVVQDLKAMVLLSLQGMGVETEKGDGEDLKVT